MARGKRSRLGHGESDIWRCCNSLVWFRYHHPGSRESRPKLFVLASHGTHRRSSSKSCHFCQTHLSHPITAAVYSVFLFPCFRFAYTSEVGAVPGGDTDETPIWCREVKTEQSSKPLSHSRVFISQVGSDKQTLKLSPGVWKAAPD